MRASPIPSRALAALRRDIAPASWPVFDQIMVSGSNFATNLFIARILGRYEFGLFTLAWIYVFLALGIQGTLIGAPLFSLSPRRAAAAQPAYLGFLLLEQLIYAAAFFAIVYAAADGGGHFFAGWAYSRYALALAAAAAAYLWQDFVRRALFARANRRGAALCDALSYPGQLAVLLLFARSGSGLNTVLWIMAATSGLAALVGMAMLGPLRFDLKEVRADLVEQWRFTRWLFGAMGLAWLSGNAAYVVAGAALGAAPVAGLRAAELVLALGALLYQSIENFLPTLAMRRLIDRGEAAFKTLLFRWTLLGFATTGAVSLVAVAAPALWLKLFFGEAMAGYGPLVYALALRNPIFVLITMGGIVLRSRDETGFIMAAEAARAAVTVATVYPVVVALGILGTAVAHTAWPLASLAVVAIGVQKCLRKPWAPTAAVRAAGAADPGDPRREAGPG